MGTPALDRRRTASRKVEVEPTGFDSRPLSPTGDLERERELAGDLERERSDPDEGVGDRDLPEAREEAASTAGVGNDQTGGNAAKRPAPLETGGNSQPGLKLEGAPVDPAFPHAREVPEERREPSLRLRVAPTAAGAGEGKVPNEKLGCGEG